MLLLRGPGEGLWGVQCPLTGVILRRAVQGNPDCKGSESEVRWAVNNEATARSSVSDVEVRNGMRGDRIVSVQVCGHVWQQPVWGVQIQSGERNWWWQVGRWRKGLFHGFWLVELTLINNISSSNIDGFLVIKPLFFTKWEDWRGKSTD